MCPCKGCEEREAECHSRCPAYKSWREEYDEKKEEQIKEAYLDVYFSNPKRAYSGNTIKYRRY